jgi:hypothetical protein
MAEFFLTILKIIFCFSLGATIVSFVICVYYSIMLVFNK